MSKENHGNAQQKTVLLTILFLLTLAVAAYAAFTFELHPHKVYMEAEAELAKGNFETASKLYAEDGAYKDSREKYGYTACVSMFKSGKASEAAELYKTLSAESQALVASRMGSFMDLGIDALSKADYDTARAYLSICELNEESKAALDALDIRAEAIELMTNGNYAQAREVLSATDDTYINATELKNECYRNEYEAYEQLSETDISAAFKGFESISDYAPAASYLRDLKQAYKQALEYMSDEDYESAEQLFSKFGNYLDSELLLDKCTRILSGETVSMYEIGEAIVLGSYNGEPLMWIVAEVNDEYATLVSQTPVAHMCYDESGASQWSSSKLCSWLKNDFVSAAFSDSEKAKLSLVTRSYGNNDLDTSIIHAISTDELNMISSELYTDYSTVWTSTSGDEAGMVLVFEISAPDAIYEAAATDECDVMAVIKVRL